MTVKYIIIKAAYREVKYTEKLRDKAIFKDPITRRYT